MHVLLVGEGLVAGFTVFVSRWRNQMVSHPTVGVALFRPKVSDQLSSSSEELPVGMKIYSYIRFRTMIAHTSAGRVARTNFFQVLYRVRY